MGTRRDGLERGAVSRRLSYVLRHAPTSVGLTIAPGGWVEVDALLAGLAAHGLALTRTQLTEVVVASDKQRFAFDRDGERIRANQGHSVPVDLQLVPEQPPAVLFHGTVASAVDAIAREGLSRRGRHHVHLSPDAATARSVGGRRGRPVVLVVAAGEMWDDGLSFFRSANGVWLTGHVPPRYLTVPSRPSRP